MHIAQANKKFPDFKIIGQLDSIKCLLDRPFTGKLLVVNSNTGIRSIELQLNRIETCGVVDNQMDQTTVDGMYQKIKKKTS